MEIRSLLSHLVEPYVTVTFASDEKQLGIVVVKRNEDSRGGIDSLTTQRRRQVAIVPHGQLTLAVTTEPDCSYAARVAQIHGLATLGAVVTNGLLIGQKKENGY